MFELVSDYQPAGDQPQAIAKLTEGVLSGARDQVLLGVTGSGKTFTVANVIKNVNKPTLVISHNKTLVNLQYTATTSRSSAASSALDQPQLRLASSK